MQEKPKHYVLDTSVLMHAPECVDPQRSPFGDNNVTIPVMVLHELDHLKMDARRGANAREVIRLMGEVFPTRETMHQGVPTVGGGRMFIRAVNGSGTFVLPKEYAGNTGDDYIIRVAGMLAEELQDTNVVLVTKDISLRLKARAAGVDADDLKTGKVQKPQALAPHIADIVVDGSVIDDLYQEGSVPVDGLPLPYGIICNTCCRLTDVAGKTHALGLYTTDTISVVRKVPEHGKRAIVPRNAEQHFAYAMAVNPNILTTILVGIAGTGKTLMALKAGVDLLEDPSSSINRILVFRPMIEIGSPLGFLPGSAEEKFSPWASAITTNLELLFARRGNNGNNGHAAQHGAGTDEDEGKKRGNKTESGREKMRRYLREGIISVQPVTFIRGTTLPNSFIIVDESQNLSPHEVKALLTRTGEGSKVVLTGDLSQIDSPHLDAASCGLAKALERMRGYPKFSAIELTRGERSQLATLVAEIFSDL